MMARRGFRSLTAIVVLASLKAVGQVSSSTVAGVVEDTTGARLPDATITLVNLMNGTENKSISRNDGSFLLPFILPGTYTLQVVHDGFTSLRLVTLNLNVGDVRQFRVRLQVSGTQQTVDVIADVAPLNAQDAQITSAVNPNLVQQLPLNGRSFQDLIAMTPGAVLQSPQVQQAGGFSVNGQPIDTNMYLIDGISANVATGPLNTAIKVPAAGQYAALTTLGTTQGLLSLDALQEFRVISSSASPEYGRGAGGQFSILSRQGTNAVHASAYASLRNGYFDAFDYFGQNNGYYHQQDVGGTLTMPLELWRKHSESPRTLLFGTYEELHVEQRQPTLTLYAPSTTLRNSSSLAMQQALQAFPSPSSFVATTLAPANGYFPSTNPPSTLKSMDFRADRTMQDRTHVFVRYGSHPSGSDTSLLLSRSETRTTNRTITAGLDMQITSALGNDVRYGWAQSSTSSRTRSYRIVNYTGSQVENDLPTALATNADSDNTRAELFLRFNAIGQTSAWTDGANASFRQLELRDAVSFQRGSHLLRAGLDLRGLHSNITPREYSMEMGYLDAAAVTSNSASYAVFRHSLPSAPVFQQYAFFAQDAWHVTPALTLSYGLRWDIDPAPTASDGHQPLTLQRSANNTTLLQLRPAGSSLWSTDWWNIAPRVGVAYQLRDTSGHELVLHGGVGILYDTPHRAAAELYRGLGFVATRIDHGVALPTTAQFPDVTSRSGSVPSASMGYILPDTVRSPWTVQWNVLAEQALGVHQTASIAVVGASGHGTLIPMRNTLQEPNASAAGYVTFPSGLTNSYHSLQVRWRGDAGTHLAWLMSYVLAHSLDDNSIHPWLQPTRGNADTDVRNNVQMGFVWTLPRARGNVLLSNALNGWSVDGRFFARSGYPVTPTGELLLDPLTGERFNRNADLDPKQSLYRYDTSVAGGRTLSGGPHAPVGAFRLAAPGVDGSAPRNIARGFGAQQLSLSLQRQIRLYSNLSLDLRADVFNVSNSPDYGYIDTQLTDDHFGRAVLSLNQSYGQSSSLYQPGGPRSLQFDFRVQW